MKVGLELKSTTQQKTKTYFDVKIRPSAINYILKFGQLFAPNIENLYFLPSNICYIY